MGFFESDEDVERRGSRAARREMHRALTKGQPDAELNAKWNTWFIETLVQARVLNKPMIIETEAGQIMADEIYALAPDWMIVDVVNDADVTERHMIPRSKIIQVSMRDMLSPDAYENGETVDQTEIEIE